MAPIVMENITYNQLLQKTDALHGCQHLSFKLTSEFAKLCELDGNINDGLDRKFDENYHEPAKLFGNYAA
ncbi:unnamed protein product [Rotaria sordida]|uniref:Uncharacterized protein n=1 Tax=Rotaria sordida TaxID=392033 RepID=A0A820F128_9BILA|nr:unnamed protein product [Rotaria sordida]